MKSNIIPHPSHFLEQGQVVSFLEQLQHLGEGFWGRFHILMEDLQTNDPTSLLLLGFLFCLLLWTLYSSPTFFLWLWYYLPPPPPTFNIGTNISPTARFGPIPNLNTLIPKEPFSYLNFICIDLLPCIRYQVTSYHSIRGGF